MAAWKRPVNLYQSTYFLIPEDHVLFIHKSNLSNKIYEWTDGHSSPVVCPFYILCAKTFKFYPTSCTEFYLILHQFPEYVSFHPSCHHISQFIWKYPYVYFIIHIFPAAVGYSIVNTGTRFTYGSSEMSWRLSFSQKPWQTSSLYHSFLDHEWKPTRTSHHKSLIM
jgi:hypothetical protein